MFLYQILVRKRIPLRDSIDFARPFLSKNMTQVYHTERKNQFIFTNIKRTYFLSFFLILQVKEELQYILGVLEH